MRLKDLFHSTLARSQTTESKKYGSQFCIYFLHFLQLEVRVSCFLTFLERSFTYLTSERLLAGGAEVMEECWEQRWHVHSGWSAAKNCQLTLSGFHIKIAHRDKKKKTWITFSCWQTERALMLRHAPLVHSRLLSHHSKIRVITDLCCGGKWGLKSERKEKHSAAVWRTISAGI